MSCDSPGFRSFRPDLIAEFSSRPNRYVVEAVRGGTSCIAHCPNPGRLREILIPGRPLALERAQDPNRKTKWTLAAARYAGEWIPLVSARSNALAGSLLLPRLYPDANASGERRLGNSRIDWLVEEDDRRTWIEVKACTLVENGRAMFPDAPSARAVKHIGELSSLPDREEGVVIFTVMNPNAEVFSPNPHTDPDFCIALSDASSRGVSIRAVAVRTDGNGFSRIESHDLPVDLSTASIAAKDGGAVVRIWEAHQSESPLWYIAVERYDSGMKRALRRKARPPAEDEGAPFRLAATLPIRGEAILLDSLAEDIARCNPAGTARGRLWPVDPAANSAFLEVVLRYRHERIFGGGWTARRPSGQSGLPSMG